MLRVVYLTHTGTLTRRERPNGIVNIKMNALSTLFELHKGFIFGNIWMEIRQTLYRIIIAVLKH